MLRGICLTTEEKARKNLSQGSRRVLVYILHITKTPTHLHTIFTDGFMTTTDTRLVAGLPSGRPGFLPRPVRVGFVADKVVVEEVLLRVLWFSAVNTITVMLHTYLTICLLLTLYKLNN